MSHMIFVPADSYCIAADRTVQILSSQGCHLLMWEHQRMAMHTERAQHSLGRPSATLIYVASESPFDANSLLARLSFTYVGASATGANAQ